jgi:hypothetical protein
MIENTSADKRRFFHAWKCLKKAECLPWGAKPKEACGQWSVKASKWDLGQHPHLKGNCPSCGRTARLNTHPKIYTYESKEAAVKMADALNREVVQ